MNLIVGPISVYVCSLNRTSLKVDCFVGLVRTYEECKSEMSTRPIKSCNKYFLSYKDSSNKTHQVGFYALNAYDCMRLAKEFNSYIHEHPGSVIKIQLKH